MGKAIVPATRTILNVFLTASLTLSQFAYADLPGENDGGTTGKQSPAKPQPQSQKSQKSQTDAEAQSYLSSTKAFHDLMQDPFVNSSYFDGLRSALRYVPDKMQADFYETNPFFQNSEMKKAEEDAMNDGVKSAILDGQTSMTRITAKTDKWLFDIIQDIAREYGYTDKDISRIEAFIMPDLNASNFSPFMDHMGIYVGKPLVDLMRAQMTNANFDRRRGVAVLKGVIGHEFMHNISGHVLQGFRNTAMVLQLGGLFAKTAGFANLDFAALENFDSKNLGKMTEEQHAFWNNIFTQSTMLDVNPHSPISDERVLKAQRKRFLKYMQAMRGQFKNAAMGKRDPSTVALGLLNGSTTASADAGQQSILGFIQMAINSLELMPVPPEQISYLKHLGDNFVQAMQENRAPYQVDANEFMTMMISVMANLSKAMETSADNGGLSQTNYKDMSEGFLRFMNVDLDPILADYVDKNGKATMTVSQMRDRSLEEKREEWKRFLTENDDATILQQLGGPESHDHPAPLKRLMHFFLSSRTAGTIAYRNSFLKTVILHDRLFLQASSAEGKIAGLKEKLKGFLAEAKKPGSQIPPEAVKFAKRDIATQIKAVEEMRAQSTASLAKVAGVVAALINDPALPKIDGRNPRLMDYLDYELALRQDRLEAERAFLAQVPAEKRAVLQQAMDSQAPSSDTPLLRSLQAQLTEALRLKGTNTEQINNRLSEISAILDPKAQIGDIQTARTQLQTDGKSLNRATRIEVEKPSLAKLFSTAGQDCRAIVERATN